MDMKSLLSAVLISTVLLMTGCKDKYEISIDAPSEITQHQTMTYRAELKTVHPQALQYTWRINGQVIDNQEQGVTQFAQTGSHVLELHAINERGVSQRAEKRIHVQSADVLTEAMTLQVRIADPQGLAIANADVTIDQQTIRTNQNGLAQFDALAQTNTMVIRANKLGYIGQTYRYSFDDAQDTASVVLSLLPQSDVQTINNDQPAIVSSNTLNTQVSLPANALVNANGETVRGDIQVQLTPINIRTMGATFLGGGAALTREGNDVNLIPLGMIDVTFSQQGQPLQLAPGQTAMIRMDVVDNVGADGRVFQQGDTIPMWWFDVRTGLWVEDGLGEIVASESALSGLALQAEVSHFTTWNWDYYFDGDRASFTLQCTREGQPLAYDESCLVTLSNLTLHRQANVGSNGLTVINANPNIEYLVSARLQHTGNQIFRGTTTFTTISGHTSVVVDVTPLDTEEGTIRCFVNNGTQLLASSCNGNIVGDQSGYTSFYQQSSYAIPFQYVPGETVDVTAWVQDFLKTTTVDTSLVAGVLTIDLIVELNNGTVTCYATLDGEQGEYFGCDGQVYSDLGQYSAFSATDFSGDPKRGYFFYDPLASFLTVTVSNVFAQNHNYELAQASASAMSGDMDQQFHIDLSFEQAIVNASYDINNNERYHVQCLYNGNPLSECQFDLYSSNYFGWFYGFISDNRADAPSWMQQHVLLNDLSLDQGYAYGNSQDNEWLYSDSVVIDHTERTIVFTMSANVPQ
ncbi:MAG: carboxypeptidase regulatory-like domain-containing protein [Bacterioplanes sp.]|nr:carboxypeptidase regulatory-like domain-containing protein [Bacterioplanes sp.]